MSQRLAKVNNGLWLLGAVVAGGLSWLLGTGLPQLHGIENKGFVQKLSLLLLVVFALIALLCLVMATRDMWAGLSSSDDSASQPQPQRATGKALQAAMAGIADRYRRRKGVTDLGQLKWFVALSVGGGGLEELLPQLQAQPLALGTDRKSNVLPQGCAWWGSSLDPNASRATMLMWALQLDAYGQIAAQPGGASSADSPVDDSASGEIELQWQETLRWLSKRGRFHGLIVTVGLEQIRAQASANSDLGFRLRGQIMAALRALSVQLPVYVVVTGCGRLAGFHEFLSPEERGSDATLGFDLDGEPGQANSQFENQLQQFVRDCEERIGERTRLSTSLEQCMATLQFAGQLRAAVPALVQLVRDLSETDSGAPRRGGVLDWAADSIWLRGLYFVEGPAGDTLPAENPPSVERYLRISPPPPRSGAGSAWGGFLAEVTRLDGGQGGGKRGQPLTPKAWLRGYVLRGATVTLLMLSFTTLLGATYGARWRLADALHQALSELRQKPIGNTRQQASMLLPEHGRIVAELERPQGRILDTSERKGLRSLGAGDFDSRFLAQLEPLVESFVAKKWESLACEPPSASNDILGQLLRFGFIEEFKLEPELATILEKAYTLYVPAPELKGRRDKLLASVESAKQAEVRRQKEKRQKRSLLEEDEYKGIVRAAPVPHTSALAPELPQLFLAEGFELFAKHAHGNCLQLQEYQQLHHDAWTKWLRRYAQHQIFIAALNASDAPSAAGYASWLARLRRQQLSIEESLGLPPPKGTPGRDLDRGVCQPLDPALKNLSLSNVQALFKRLKSELPRAVGVLSAEVQAASQSEAARRDRSGISAQLYAPFQVLEPLTQEPPSKAYQDYLTKLDGVAAAYRRLQDNSVPAQAVELAPTDKDVSWQRAAFDLLTQLEAGDEKADLLALRKARQALITGLEQNLPADPSGARSRATLTALNDILRGAELVAFETLSRLAADYVRTRMEYGRTIATQTRQTPNQANLAKLLGFITTFAEKELEMVIPSSARGGDSMDAQAHHLVTQTSWLRKIRTAAQGLTDQAPPVPPPAAAAPAPAAPAAAPAPEPAAPNPPSRVQIEGTCKNRDLVSKVTLVQGNAVFQCKISGPGGAGSCAKESAFQSSDWLEVFTNAPAHRPLKHSVSLNAATWPKLGCPGDPQHERCFRVVEGDLMDGDRKTLCSLVLHVYMTNDVTPKKPKAADPETPSIAKLEIPVWDRQECWLRWDAPEPPSR